MLELCGQLDLTPEPFDVDGGREVGWEYLDDYLPAERDLLG